MSHNLRKRPSQSLRAREAQGDYELPLSRQSRQSSQADDDLSARIKANSKPYNPNLPPPAFPTRELGDPGPTEPAPAPASVDTLEALSAESSELEDHEEEEVAAGPSNSNQTEMAKEPVNAISEDAVSVPKETETLGNMQKKMPIVREGIKATDKNGKSKKTLPAISDEVASGSSKSKTTRGPKQVNKKPKSILATVSQVGASREMPIVESIEKPDVTLINSAMSRISVDPDDLSNQPPEPHQSRYRRLDSQPAPRIGPNPLSRIAVTSIHEVGWDVIAPALQWAIFCGLIVPPGAPRTAETSRVLIIEAAKKLGHLTGQLSALLSKNESALTEDSTGVIQVTSPEPNATNAFQAQPQPPPIDHCPNKIQLDQARQFLLERGLDAGLLGGWEEIGSSKAPSPAPGLVAAQKSLPGHSGKKQAKPKAKVVKVEGSEAGGNKRKRVVKAKTEKSNQTGVGGGGKKGKPAATKAAKKPKVT